MKIPDFKKLKQSFSDDRSSLIESQMLEENLRALQLMSILEIASAIAGLLMPEAAGFHDIGLYKGIHMTALAVHTGVFLLLRFFVKRHLESSSALHILMLSYTAVASVLSGAVSIIDTRNDGGFFPFLTTQVLIFGMILMRTRAAAILCGIYFAVFLAAAARLTDFPLTKYTNTLIFYAAVIAVNTFHFRSAAAKFHDAQTILEENDRLNHLTTTDGLTGVQNRLGLRLAFDSISSKDLLVMMCDIDHFKQQNDLYGHAAGDEALRSLAFILSSLFEREHVYRYGGDEFLVIAPFDSEEALKKEIEKAEKEYVDLCPSGMGHPTFSCGYVYGACPNETVLRDMVRAADTMLYEAKSRGRNRAFGERYQEKAR